MTRLTQTLLVLALSGCATPFTNEFSDAVATETLTVLSEVARPRFVATRDASWTWYGEADYLGEPAIFRFEWEGDSFRRALEGRLGRTLGFDGSEGWSQSSQGLVRPLVLEELDRERFLTAALTGAWIDAQAPLSAHPRTADDGTITVELRLDDSPLTMDLVVDRDSGEPLRLEGGSESGRVVWGFEGWQVRNGALVPSLIRHAAAEGSIENSIRLVQIEQGIAGDTSELFGRPQSAPRNVTFHDSVHPRIEARRVETGHVLVRPVVDGREVGWFVFDSGAGGLVIDDDIADSLNLRGFGKVVAVGVSGRTDARFREASSLRLGPLEISDPLFVELSLDFLEGAFGVPVAGLVGYDVLAHSIVLFDQENRVERDPILEIHAPDSGVFADATWSKLTLDERLPCIEASFEGGHSGLFKIDTGASGNLTFHAPAVKRFDLARGRKLQQRRTAGVGGVGRSWSGKVDWLEIAGQRFEDLEVEFADGKVGAFADVYTMGNLGQGLLGNFRLVFDYGRERIALIPRDH